MPASMPFDKRPKAWHTGAMIHASDTHEPRIHPSSFVAWNADVIGDATLEEDSSVWFSAVVRADVAAVHIGKRSNIQDGAVVHVDEGIACTIGDDVTVGHRAVLHGCTVGNGCLIGMGAVVLDKAVIGEQSVVGAGALVTQGKTFPPRSLIVGSPAKAIRTLGDEDVAAIAQNAGLYVQLAKKAARYKEIKRP